MQDVPKPYTKTIKSWHSTSSSSSSRAVYKYHRQLTCLSGHQAHSPLNWPHLMANLHSPDGKNKSKALAFGFTSWFYFPPQFNVDREAVYDSSLGIWSFFHPSQCVSGTRLHNHLCPGMVTRPHCKPGKTQPGLSSATQCAFFTHQNNRAHDTFIKTQAVQSNTPVVRISSDSLNVIS